MNKKSNAAGLAVQARTVTLYHQDTVKQDDPVIALAERLMRLYDAHGEALTALSPYEKLMFNWRKNHPEADERRERTAELLTGFAAADAIAGDAGAASWKAMEALRDAVPLTFAGLAAKAKAARYIGDHNLNSDLGNSLVRDIGVLAGEIDADRAPGARLRDFESKNDENGLLRYLIERAEQAATEFVKKYYEDVGAEE